jgi:flavin-dependent dehydrogenase
MLPNAQPTPDQMPVTRSDVTVIGAGLAGKAASLHLAKAGLEITCIEPPTSLRDPVGESLDWSAPELLRAVGLAENDLIRTEIATRKQHVTVQLVDGCSEQYIPSPWLGGPPFHIGLGTLHVDRVGLDQALLNEVAGLGVRLVRDKVIGVERNGGTIVSVRTAGARFSSPWFIDASGFSTRLLAREFNLPAIDYGPPKVGIWSYFPVSQLIEGTTLYMDPKATEYLEWIWEIPINPRTVSVGCIATGAAIKARREEGLSVEEIFQQQLIKFPRFAPLLEGGTFDPPRVTSFQSRAHVGVAGPNWLIAGEAASMVDPITANGVTAALRHAEEASDLILRFRRRGKLPLTARAAYSTRNLQMASFFNSGIERVVYEPAVRNRIGMLRSGTVYTGFAWSMNVVYSRLRPRGLISSFFFGLPLRFFRASAWVLYQLCQRRKPAVAMPG